VSNCPSLIKTIRTENGSFRQRQGKKDLYKLSDVIGFFRQADFNAKLEEAGARLVVADFYATWCGPCKTIAPKVAAMANEMKDVVFLKIDVDENEVSKKVSLQYIF